MKRNNNKHLLIVLLVVLFITVGYAVLASAFDLNSLIGIKNQTFSIHFDNVEDDGDDYTLISGPSYTDDKQTEINFEVSLDNLGSYLILYADIVNDGTIDGEIDEIKVQGIPEDLSEVVYAKIVYDGDYEMKVGDSLAAGESVRVKYILKYVMPEGLVEELPDTSRTFTVTLNVKYVRSTKNTSHEEDEHVYVGSYVNDLIRLNANNIYSSSNINFNKSYHSGTSGLYQIMQNGYPIYFYRGNYEDTHNYLVTQNVCWRIIRTTTTGGIKLLYDGPVNSTGGCNEERLVNYYSYYSYDSYIDFDISDIAYLFTNCGDSWGGGGGETVMSYGPSFTKGEATRGVTYDETNLCTLVDNEYVEDNEYCNNFHFYQDDITDLSCEEGREMSVANGKLTIPMGVIDLPEANLCGFNVNDPSNSWVLDEYYSYWTMSVSRDFRSPAIGMIDNNNPASLPNMSQNSVLPVITLKNTVRLSGEGTRENPYIVEGLEPIIDTGGGER